MGTGRQHDAIAIQYADVQVGVARRTRLVADLDPGGIQRGREGQSLVKEGLLDVGGSGFPIPHDAEGPLGDRRVVHDPGDDPRGIGKDQESQNKPLHLAGKYIQIGTVNTNRTDVWIRGGGVAGLTAAWHCRKAGLQVVVTDTAAIGSGASGAWWALMNPATGVQPAPVAGIRQAMVGFELMRNELGLDGVGWIKAGIWRPALDKALANGFAKAAAHPDWPAGWLRMDRPMHGLAGSGVLRVAAGYAIDMRLWLTAVAARLGAMGVDIRENVPQHHTVPARHRVDCIGMELLTDPAWAHLRLHPIKGQLREVLVNGIRGQFPALSARGYAIQTDTDRWVIGSTYEHDFTDAKPDAAYDAYLIDRFKAMFPQPVSVTVVGRWAGVRIGSHNRQPILARHPEDETRWAVTGMGSKGLVYSQILGRELADRLTADP